MAETDSLPSLSSNLVPRNVVVAGETGVGKSSFINLVIGSDSATTANDVRGVTTHTDFHLWQSDQHAFRLWDTPGLGEGSFGSVPPRNAQRALRALLKELTKEGGVHLLVMCIRGISHVTKGTKQTYDIIHRIRNEVSPQIPIVAVVTGLEERSDETNILPSMEEWWSMNQDALTAFDMTFFGHACLTTLNDDDHPPIEGRRVHCQLLARNLLIDYALPPIPCNAVVVGEVGVGKSSLINLVTGMDSTVATSDVRAVTVGTSYYDWDLSQTQTFRLWDTPGLSDGPAGASTRQAVRVLLTKLARGAGVHLIIICYRGGRQVTDRMKRTYDAVRALRDRVAPDTPIVAVITGLERDSNARDVLAGMDDWWLANASTLSGLQMTFASHACITNLPDDAHPPIPGRRDECQRLVRNLIIDHALTPRSAPTQGSGPSIVNGSVVIIVSVALIAGLSFMIMS